MPVEFCRSCVVPRTRPRVTFTDGECNACRWHRKKKQIDWSVRWAELEKLCDRFRRSNGDFDCIVPVSGGKDSSYIAMQLRDRLGMHPLTITFAHPLWSRLGWTNWNNFVNTGFDNILITPDQRQYRKFARDAFVSRAMPKQPFVCGISTAIIKMAKKFDIELVVYAEQGEAEYGGDEKTTFLEKFNRDFLVNIYYEGQGDTGKYGPWWEIPSEADLERLHVTWWSNFENWDPQDHAIYAKQYCGMEMHVGGQIGTFVSYAQNEDEMQHLHCFCGFIKFGFSRCLSDAAIEVRHGRMSRDQAVQVVNKLDGQFPVEYLPAYLDYFEMAEPEFWAVIDRHVNHDILRATGRIERPWVLKEGVR